MPLVDPKVVLIVPVTAGSMDETTFCIAPRTVGANGPRTKTFWLAPVPVKVTCSTRSSRASPVLSILIW